MLINNAELLEVLAHISFNLIAFDKRRARAGYKDDVVRSTVIRVEMIKRRTDDSAAAVSVDCLTDLF